MVKAGPLEVSVVCIPVEFEGVGATVWKDFEPFDTTIYTWVRHKDTKQRLNGVPVYLMRRFQNGPWERIGDTTSKRMYDSDGYCGISARIAEGGKYEFYYHVEPNTYCYAYSVVLTVYARKAKTDMGIGATIGNPTPDQPYDIYGRLRRIEPTEEYLNGKTVKLYERPKDGTWSPIATLKTFRKSLAGVPYDGWYEKTGLKKTSGVWEYLAEFEGDAWNEGCVRQSGLGASLGPVYFR